MSKMSKNARINLGISRELLKRIDNFAQTMGLDRTNAIRLMLSQYLDYHEGQQIIRVFDRPDKPEKPHSK